MPRTGFGAVSYRLRYMPRTGIGAVPVQASVHAPYRLRPHAPYRHRCMPRTGFGADPVQASASASVQTPYRLRPRHRCSPRTGFGLGIGAGFGHIPVQASASAGRVKGKEYIALANGKQAEAAFRREERPRVQLWQRRAVRVEAAEAAEDDAEGEEEEVSNIQWLNTLTHNSITPLEDVSFNLGQARLRYNNCFVRGVYTDSIKCRENASISRRPR